MFSRKTLLLLLISLWNLPEIFAQIDESFVRDSTEIERGLAGTMDFEPSFRLVNQAFDEGNRPLRSILYRYTSPDDLVREQQQTFEYDDNGNKTMFLLEQWNAAEEEWVPVKQEDSNYNLNGRLSSLTRMIAVQGELQNRRRWTYQYNAAAMETEKRLEAWNSDTEAWENLSRKSTSYTAEGQIEEQLLENFNGTVWVPRRKRTWTYELGQLQPSETLGQVWSSSEEAWVNNSRKAYAMAANGLWSGSIVQVWDSTAEEWVNDVKETFTIDLDNSESTFNIETWDGDWKEDARSQYSYSLSENQALLQRWNSTDKQHENFLRYRSLFNNDRLPVQQTGMQAWDANDETWENRNYTRRVTYFWRNNDPTSTDAPIANHCVIPNPYWSGTSINCELFSQDFPLRLEVYNVYGQLVQHKQVNSPSFAVETSSLPYGLYVFKLSDEQQIYQLQKVVVTK